MTVVRRGLTFGTSVGACCVMALLAGSVRARAQAPPPTPPTDSARTKATDEHRQAVERLRDAARAIQGGDAAGFARAITDSARHVRAVIEAATWLPASVRDALTATAAGLEARATQGPSGYSPDADLAALDRVGMRVRGTGNVEVVFEGSFARSQPKDPVAGGHATAMAAPVAPPAATPGQPPAPGTVATAGPATGAPVPVTSGSTPQHDIRFDVVRGQLTEKTFGGGISKLHLVESGGNGVALVDYDGDGRLDIYTVSAFDLDEKKGRARIPHRSALYRNLGGMKFENVAAKAGVDAAAWGYGVCAGDVDGDGRIDLYVTNYGANLLYRSKGDGTFEEVAAAAGVAASGWSTGCAFLDADRDGDLDLYVARYATIQESDVANPERFLMWRGVAKVMFGPTGLPGATDLFFENTGDGTFKEATEAWGLLDRTSAYGFAVVATDYDGDGWTDIFVANDSNPNFLYRNRAGKGFESLGLASGVAVNADGRAQAGMGADSGDFDGDGRLDLVVTTFAFDANALYRNTGDGSFEDVSLGSGFATTFEDMSWGVAFLDADLDGDLDLYFASGHLFPQVDEYPALAESYGQRDQVFANEGGRFRDVSATAGRGLALQKPSRALAVGDLDNDGDPDVVVTVMDEEPILLENTQQSGRHWLGVSVRQQGSNQFGIGARLSAECGGRTQVREVRSGGGYLSQNDLRGLFGLGGCAGPVTVGVRLGQTEWRFTGVAADRHVSLTLDPSHEIAR